MRLLFVLPEYAGGSSHGGIATFYKAFLPYLVSLGHSVHVIFGSGFYTDVAGAQYSIDGVSVEALDHDRFVRQLRHFSRYSSMPSLQRHLAAAWAMWEQIENRDDFDLVEVTDWGLLFLPWVLRSGPPVLVQLHGSVGQIDIADPLVGEEAQGVCIRGLETQGLRKAHALQAGSQLNANFWSGELSRPVKRIFPCFRPPELNVLAAGSTTEGLVVGRIQYWKGPDILCEALQLLGPSSISVNWIGRDTPFREFNSSMGKLLAAKYPSIWGGRIKPLGQLDHADVAQHQVRSSFTVVPSRWDTFSYACVEAMGAGAVVICSTGAGASELIQDEVNGLLFKKDSAEALASTLRKFLSLSKAQRSEIGGAAKATIEKILCPEKICAERVLEYERVAREKNLGVAHDDWLNIAGSPEENPRGIDLRLLDQLAMKSLLKYVCNRAIKKITQI